MMAHATALLPFLTRPDNGIPEDARVVYQRRRIEFLAADLNTVTVATRALLDELYPFLTVLPMAWDDAAEVVGWVAPRDRLNLLPGDDHV